MNLSIFEKACIAIITGLLVFVVVFSCEPTKPLIEQNFPSQSITNTGHENTEIVCVDEQGKVMWTSDIERGETLRYGPLIEDQPTSSTKLFIKIGNDGGIITTPHRRTKL